MAIVFSETAAPERELHLVGMGEIVVTDSPNAELSCIGLGSCVAVCAYDVREKIGGMAHIVLPQYNGLPGSNRAKFADTAVPMLIDEMLKKGGVKSRLIIKIAGGAQMTIAPGLRDTFKTGERNLEQIMSVLRRENITPAAADTGGSVGRTVRMYVKTGRVTVKTAYGMPQEL
ncbi:MAG: chemotaxis protein CheD [Dehalococcoidales bacterium]|nr:chemotaxis protein CheD [Dehalococcoidales bacterium]